MTKGTRNKLQQWIDDPQREQYDWRVSYQTIAKQVGLSYYAITPTCHISWQKASTKLASGVYYSEREAQQCGTHP